MLSQGGLQKLMKMSWVTLDRICEEERISDPKIRRLIEGSNRPLRSGAEQLSDEDLLEKLRGFGFDLDRAGLEQLCEGALSAEEVAARSWTAAIFGPTEETQGEWIWICVVSLWQRWWPEKVCLELLDDKIQSGYHELERNETGCAATWLAAWSDVVRLCEITGIHSIGEFDDRFPMTQSLFNWSQDLEDALWNAGLEDPSSSGQDRGLRGRAREVPRRGPADARESPARGGRVPLRAWREPRRPSRSLSNGSPSILAGGGAGSAGRTSTFTYRRPKNYGRAEELLRRGYSTPGVRDKEDIAQGLPIVCKKPGASAKPGAGVRR